MEQNTPNNKFMKTAITVLITAIVQSIIFCLIIGLPLPQFFSSRDVESLQFQQLPEQKRTQPIEALENPAPAPKAVVQKAKPKPTHVAAVKAPEPKSETSSQPEPQAQSTETPTKVLLVNFEKSKEEDKKSEPAKSDEKPKLVPVTDKLADVQGDDSKTEATTEMNQNPEPTTPADSTELAN